MAEADISPPQPVCDPVASVTPPPTSTEPVTTTDSAGEPRRRLDPGHPFVKLAILGLMMIALGGVAALHGEPEARALAAAPGPSAPVAASLQASEAMVVPGGENVPHDVDDAERAPTPRQGSRSAKRSPTSHAPDAKAGVTTGYQAGEPVRVKLTIIDGKPVEEQTAAAFRKMRAAARRDGVTLQIVSGFRTMDRQRELYDDYRAGRGNLAARPGHSNHQSGHALDLAVSAPKVRAWLEGHAASFGFQRTVPSEPWHWEH